MRHVIIGDIHGCYDELQALLDLVAPARDDEIIALGDIVDRGPQSERVLEFFRDTPNATSLMGNHERKHIRAARGEVQPALGQKIVAEQLGERYTDWLAFMATFRRHIELPEAILVHGFFEPGVPLDQQKDNVVIGTLTGEDYITRKLPAPWYEHYDGAKPLVFGHHDYLRTGEPVIREGRVYGLDTGCAHGSRLTALVLPEFRLVSVPSRADYWVQQRQQYAHLIETRDELDAEWKALKAYAALPDERTRTPSRRARADRCRAILDEAQRVGPQLLGYVRTLGSEILTALCLSQDWESCSEQQRSARFAHQAKQHALASLLFVWRRGRLDVEWLEQHAKTPRGLFAWARAAGVDLREVAESTAEETTDDEE